MKETVRFTDVIGLDGLIGARITADGYLTAAVRAGRSGVQIYKGWEVGKPDVKEVRVYRPPEEVFNKDAMHSYAHRPVTNDHPPVSVDSESWKKYAVGSTGEEVVRDGEYVVVPLVLMDAGVIKDYRKGKKQLSWGYQTELTWDSGTAPDGDEYDAVQTQIRANHLAVVTSARGGPELKIGDDNEGEGTMDPVKLKTITVDSISVDVTDTAAQFINRALEQRDSQIKTLAGQVTELQSSAAKIATDAKTASDAGVKIVETKDAEIATLKKQLEDAKITPQALDALVVERVAAVTTGRKILGDKLVVDGKSAAEIRRQVVDAHMGDAAKGWSDDAVSASFASITKSNPGSGGGGRDSLADALSARVPVADKRDDAYEEYNKRLTGAWNNKAAAA